jgi:hypothetical protein
LLLAVRNFRDSFHYLNERFINPFHAIAPQSIESDDSDNEWEVQQSDCGLIGIIWDNRKTTIETVSMGNLNKSLRKAMSAASDTTSFRKAFCLPSSTENKIAAAYMFVDAVQHINQ